MTLFPRDACADSVKFTVDPKVLAVGTKRRSSTTDMVITLVSISPAFDTSDSMGRMVLNILLTFSQFEREMIGERVRDSLRARKRHGKIHGGKPPFGYQVVDDALVIDDHEAEIVGFIFAEFLKTERYLAVQRAVEERGFVSSVKPLRKGGTRGGVPISPTIVHSVLQNPVYVGEIRGHDGNHPGQHVPIIAREVWAAAQKLTRVPCARTRPAYSEIWRHVA